MLSVTAPEKIKLKVEGATMYQIENIWKQYGVIYKKMEPNDKLYICSLILDGYTLDTFEKGFFLIILSIFI